LLAEPELTAAKVAPSCDNSPGITSTPASSWMDAFAFQPTHIPGDEAVFVGNRIHDPPKPWEAIGECPSSSNIASLYLTMIRTALFLYHHRFSVPLAGT
jgi:hypothetical protein